MIKFIKKLIITALIAFVVLVVIAFFVDSDDSEDSTEQISSDSYYSYSDGSSDSTSSDGYYDSIYEDDVDVEDLDFGTESSSESSGKSMYQEKAVASYYAASLAGNLTASGEPYDPKKLTCAHKTLPFGTKLLVTNLKNGKSVLVIVNDRGPYPKGRDIDLSNAAAEKIDMTGQGLANVSIEIIED